MLEEKTPIQIGPGRRTIASRRYQDRSRYAPHQGAKEKARRLAKMPAPAAPAA